MQLKQLNTKYNWLQKSCVDIIDVWLQFGQLASLIM